VRGDHGEVVVLLVGQGGKVISKEGNLIDLSDSRLSGNVRIFGELDPEWEVRGRGRLEARGLVACAAHALRM
jgi:hypothetical protein